MNRRDAALSLFALAAALGCAHPGARGKGVGERAPELRFVPGSEPRFTTSWAVEDDGLPAVSADGARVVATRHEVSTTMPDPYCELDVWDVDQGRVVRQTEILTSEDTRAVKDAATAATVRAAVERRIAGANAALAAEGWKRMTRVQAEGVDPADALVQHVRAAGFEVVFEAGRTLTVRRPGGATAATRPVPSWKKLEVDDGCPDEWPAIRALSFDEGWRVAVVTAAYVPASDACPPQLELVLPLPMR